MKYVGLVLLVLFSVQCQKGNLDASKPKDETSTNKVNTQLNLEDISVPDVDPKLAALGPMESIKELDKTIETYKSGPNLSREDEEANKKLKERVIRGTFDLFELCRLSLDKHWNEIDESQRKYFANLMTRLLERKAIFSKEQVKGNGKAYNVSYNKETYLDDEKKSALVATKINVPSEKVDLTINYKLLSTVNGWKIFDVIVDDASLVENYKFQFDTIITKYGYQELINRMEKKLSEMGSSH